ncbi:MAG: helix-turn-helix transcriptional regulator [Lachnospiraceae bacterium]|nr:helix-turn-helix transcriptional regulator [Lachnospiraceae bacterium]
MDYEMQLQVLQKNLYKLMHESNTSMRQLSADAGVSPSYVQKLLSGDINPRLDKLVELGNCFSTSSSQLLNDEVPPSLLRQEINSFLVEFDDDALEFVLEMCKRMK